MTQKIVKPTGPGLEDYLHNKIEELELAVRDKSLNLKRLEAQRNKLNSQGNGSD
jgi:26S proteasome regulatory subunit T6